MSQTTYGFSDFVPRQVPASVRLRVLFGGFLSQFGWLFLGFGMIFVWVFQVDSALASFIAFRGRLESTTGTVAECRKTSYTVNNSPVYATHYAFKSPDGRTHKGVSYSTGAPPAKGAPVTVEYPKGNPGTSRIKGMSTTPFGMWVSFVLVFPALGFVFAAIGMRKGVRGLRLLTHGKTGKGKLLSKEPTNTKINDQTVYKLTFEFVAEDGKTYQAKAKTHHTARLEDETEEPLVYDPLNPSYAVMMDALPGSPRIGEMGTIESRRPLVGLLVLVIPLTTILGHGFYVLSRYIG